MGLDITAFSKLTPVGKHTVGWCEDENHVAACAYESFPQSFRGLPILGTQGHAGIPRFIDGGCYARTDATKTHSFRAGSYSGYNHWRFDLARQFNPCERSTFDSMTEPDPDLPFYELIWFADNEGTIGPDAARDLLADFREHADRYDPVGLYGDYSREKYADWTRACELAADSGLIDFH
jgi:hypothetical protein